MVGIADGKLPGLSTGESPPVILHVDIDCFYAACERLREPELVGQPVVIGMGYDAEDPHGAVATASYEARDYGVESAMPISKALERLPRRVDAETDPDLDVEHAGFYRPVDMNYYKQVSEDVRAILRDSADTIEPVSIDEAYLDLSAHVDWGDVEAFSARLKDRIKSEVGVVPSLGVAPTKSAAKVASDRDKPDGLVIVQPGTVQDFFASLDIETIHGIGPVTADALREMGIDTGQDLVDADPTVLVDRFGSRGREFYQRALGDDPRSVSPPDDPKSLSRESSTGDPITDIDAKRRLIGELADDVAKRATDKDALYQTVGIKVVTPPYDVHTRAQSLSGPIDDPDLVNSIARDLLEEFAETSVRKLGVRVSNLVFSDRYQADLDTWDGVETVTPRELPTPTDPGRVHQTTLHDFIE